MEVSDVIKKVEFLFKKDKICEDWYLQMLQDNNLQKICKMWFAGSDWSIKNNFPDLETLRAFKGKSEKYGLFTDFVGEIFPREQMAFFGESKISMNVVDFDVTQIYLRDNSVLEINADLTSKVEINLLDNSKAIISGATVRVYGNKTNAEWI